MLLHMSGVGYVCLSCLESRNNAKCCAEWGIEMFGMCEDGLVRKKFELSVFVVLECGFGIGRDV